MVRERDGWVSTKGKAVYALLWSNCLLQFHPIWRDYKHISGPQEGRKRQKVTQLCSKTQLKEVINYYLKTSWDSSGELPFPLFSLIFTHKSLITGMRYLWGEELKVRDGEEENSLTAEQSMGRGIWSTSRWLQHHHLIPITFPSSLWSAGTDRHCQRPLISASDRGQQHPGWTSGSQQLKS